MSDSVLYSHRHIKGCWEYHLQWCTKYRFHALWKESIRLDCEAVLRECASVKRLHVLELAVMPDHVHIVVRCEQSQNPSELVGYLKGKSAYALFQKHPNMRRRYWGGHFWSRGSFQRTMSDVGTDTVRAYVRAQHDAMQTKLAQFTQNPRL